LSFRLRWQAQLSELRGDSMATKSGVPQARGTVAPQRAAARRLVGAPCQVAAVRHRAAVAAAATPAGAPAAAAAPSASAAALAAAAAYAAKRGVALDRVAFESSFASGQRILVAAKDIGPGEAILSVPEAAWAAPGPLAARSPLAAALAGLEPWLQLALLLLHARAGGAGAGELGELLPGLPSAAAPNSPLVWSPAERAPLAGSQLAAQADGYLEFFRGKHAELEGGVFSANRALFPAERYSLDAFLWAVSAVRGAVHGPLEGERLAVVPLISALPHRRRAKAKLALRSAGCACRLAAALAPRRRQRRHGGAGACRPEHAPREIGSGQERAEARPAALSICLCRLTLPVCLHPSCSLPPPPRPQAAEPRADNGSGGDGRDPKGRGDRLRLRPLETRQLDPAGLRRRRHRGRRGRVLPDAGAAAGGPKHR